MDYNVICHTVNGLTATQYKGLFVQYTVLSGVEMRRYINAVGGTANGC